MKVFFMTCLGLGLWLVGVSVEAGNYYVSNGAKGTWAGAVNRSTPCSYATANLNAVAGDTVTYLNDGGVFFITGNFIEPANSGVKGSPITFEAEEGAKVEVYHSGNGAYLRNRSYITISRFVMKRTGSGGWVDIRNRKTSYASHHITIQDCTFRDSSPTKVWGGIWITGDNHHIEILNNDINNTYGNDMSPDDLIHIRPGGVNYKIEYIRIEGNRMLGGCHSACGIHNGLGGILRYVVVKNNIIRNPNHRAMEVYSDDSLARPSYILLENNVFADSGSICSQDNCYENVYGSESDKKMGRWRQPNLQWVAEYSVVRRNQMYNGGTGGPFSYVPDGNYSRENRFYHNVIYKNGYGSWLNSNVHTGNIFVNNVFADNDISIGTRNLQIYLFSTSSPCDNLWRSNNFDGSESVSFRNYERSPGVTTVSWLEENYPAGWTNNLRVPSRFVGKTSYDFRLADGSDLIDAGDWLTTTRGAGNNSKTLVVEDARYFTDGYGLITGDSIQLEGDSTPVTVLNIDYVTNSITLSKEKSWTSGMGVGLAYSGAGPDIGAHEFSGKSVPIASPGVLRVINMQR